jgi:hypothetical protein
MDQDFTPSSTALARAQFWRDGRKWLEENLVLWTLSEIRKKRILAANEVR